MAARIKAYANCDHTYVAWRLDARVPGCRGFALRRRLHGEEPETAGTWVGFPGQPAPSGTIKPSTEWPIQKFAWADLGVHPGDVVSYQAVPMVGKPGALTAVEDGATPWSDELTVEPHGGEGLAAYFNRGIVASQWLSRRLQEKAPGHEGTALKTEIDDPASPIRAFLGGPLRERMLALLDEIKAAGAVAAQVRAQWDKLRDAGDVYPPALLDANDQRKHATLRGQGVGTWFVAARDEVDLAEARGLIDAAKQGILFLMFNPGPVDTLLNAIVD